MILHIESHSNEFVDRNGQKTPIWMLNAIIIQTLPIQVKNVHQVQIISQISSPRMYFREVFVKAFRQNRSFFCCELNEYLSEMHARRNRALDLEFGVMSYKVLLVMIVPFGIMTQPSRQW